MGSTSENESCWRDHLNTLKYMTKLNPKMTHFKDHYYYLKSIRWILNNSLADTTIGSPLIITSSVQKEKHLAKEHARIPDLEMRSEYKVKRLAEETRG
jgi:hypothetical protein